MTKCYECQNGYEVKDCQNCEKTPIKKGIVVSSDKLVIDISKVGRTKAQKKRLMDFAKSMDLNTFLKYLESFKGSRMRDLKYETKSFDSRRVKKTDVLAQKEPGSILKKFNSLKRLDVSHKPLNGKSDWIGIEIECLIPVDAFDSSHSETCLHCEGSGEIPYQDDDGETQYEECSHCHGSGTIDHDDSNVIQSARRYFKDHGVTLSSVKSDGSIESEDSAYTGIEITVLTRLSQPSHLKKVCSILKEIGAKVNKTCGLHIHLDSRHLSQDEVRLIGNKFKRALPALLGVVPSSRRGNRYCKASVSRMTGCRYHAVNLTAFDKYKTIEVRLHSATTDFDKIMLWVELCNSIAKTPNKIKTCQTVNDLEEYLNISEKCLEYFTQREAKFSPEKHTQVPSSLSMDGLQNLVVIPDYVNDQDLQSVGA